MPSPIPPSVIDQRARAEGTTIAHLRDLIPKECFVIEPWRSWSALAVAVLRLAASIYILTRIEPAWGPGLVWQIPALAAAWLFAGWCFTGIFVIGHDCGHMAFSERRWVNELVGHVCLSPEFTGFHNWRIWHNYHHAKTQLRGQDPDWAEKMMTRAEYEEAPLADKAHVRLGFGTPLGILVGFWKGMFRRTFMKTTAPQIPVREEGKLLFSSAMMVLMSGAIGAWLVHAGGAWALVKYYLVPVFIAAAHGAMLTYLHHTSADSMVFDKADWTPFRGQVASTFNVRFPRVRRGALVRHQHPPRPPPRAPRPLVPPARRDRGHPGEEPGVGPGAPLQPRLPARLVGPAARRARGRPLRDGAVRAVPVLAVEPRASASGPVLGARAKEASGP